MKNISTSFWIASIFIAGESHGIPIVITGFRSTFLDASNSHVHCPNSEIPNSIVYFPNSDRFSIYHTSHFRYGRSETLNSPVVMFRFSHRLFCQIDVEFHQWWINPGETLEMFSTSFQYEFPKASQEYVFQFWVSPSILSFPLWWSFLTAIMSFPFKSFKSPLLWGIFSPWISPWVFGCFFSLGPIASPKILTTPGMSRSLITLKGCSWHLDRFLATIPTPCHGICWDMEVSWVIGVPPVIIHFERWDFPVHKNHPASWGYLHDYGNPHIGEYDHIVLVFFSDLLDFFIWPTRYDMIWYDGWASDPSESAVDRWWTSHEISHVFFPGFNHPNLVVQDATLAHPQYGWFTVWWMFPQMGDPQELDGLMELLPASIRSLRHGLFQLIIYQYTLHMYFKIIYIYIQTEIATQKGKKQIHSRLKIGIICFSIALGLSIYVYMYTYMYRYTVHMKREPSWPDIVKSAVT